MKFNLTISFFFVAFTPLKSNKIDGDILEDVQHADVGKDDIAHAADAATKDEIDYDEYYDVC